MFGFILFGKTAFFNGLYLFINLCGFINRISAQALFFGSAIGLLYRVCLECLSGSADYEVAIGFGGNQSSSYNNRPYQYVAAKRSTWRSFEFQLSKFANKKQSTTIRLSCTVNILS